MFCGLASDLTFR